MVLATRETATQRHWTCGRRLRERRHALGLTQAELVGRLGGDPAITNRSISTWENGRGLDFGWLPELAAALDCSVTYLLGMTDDPQRWDPAPDAAAEAVTAGAPQGSADRPAADATCNWILGPGPIPPDRPAADRLAPDRPARDRRPPDRDVPPAAEERESS